MADYKLLIEEELITLLKAGDERAFGVLYDQYKERLAGNLYKLLKSSELTKEILQDLFLKIWDTREQLDPKKSFRSYLFRIGENMVNDYYRKAARDRSMRNKMMLANTELYSHIEENLFSKENAELLQQAVDKMPPQRKLVFTLCKLEGKSYKEVEQIMGINAKTINSHLFQANKFLKQYFTPKSGAALAMVLAAIFKDI
ncbi:RNA polymerase sigma factor [Pedobacter ginsengisoli]|uniref:RNA polymerase sigma factor n=1 Tax=Pedobacter ginsengisoli TaxID=363852 RepID=UPI00254B4983|nr:sigma-70 family RNA polymerase sigma factor [Pedobacter ginsengisoli]